MTYGCPRREATHSPQRTDEAVEALILAERRARRAVYRRLAQPDAAASEPVFWTAPTRPVRPVRPDDQSPFYADADPADPSAGDFPVDAPESA